MNKNKHYLVQLFLSIICFITVFSGRLETVSDWLLLGGAVCACLDLIKKCNSKRGKNTFRTRPNGNRHLFRN